MIQDKSIRDLMNQYEDDICYLQQMHIYSMSTYEKNYYHEQIKKTTDVIIKELENIMYMEQKNYNKRPLESNYYINSKAEKYGTTEDYQYILGNECIIHSEQDTENEFILRLEPEVEDDFLNNMETNEETHSNITSPEPIMDKEFTLEELKEYNGTNGKPAYVAINGNVYDMSNIGPWSGGTHFGLLAGNNLTDQFMGCHRGAQSVLDKLTQVGKIVQ